jgi:hypothetical protein
MAESATTFALITKHKFIATTSEALIIRPQTDVTLMECLNLEGFLACE